MAEPGIVDQDQGFTIETYSEALSVKFQSPMLASSWAIVGGGQGQYLRVVNQQVKDSDLRPPNRPLDIIEGYCQKMDWHEPTIGLMTSADINQFCFESRSHQGLTVYCLATVGLGNALRVGDPTNNTNKVLVGTINIICWCSEAIHQNAHFEAISLIAEAKTAAVLDAGILSTKSLRPATGTGTDCSVFLSPEGHNGKAFVGKHTEIGSLLGDATYSAVKHGIEKNLAARN